jgi:hypothetical protein
MRIRSKVSTVSKGGSEKGDSPSLPSSVSTQARLRSTSSSSNMSQASNAPATQQFYPITTAAPAANPYRYNPMRAPPISRTYTPPPINSINMGGSPSPVMTQPPTRPRVNGPAKVDLNSIPNAPSPLVPTPGSPLPPSSPPISALSFSSRSSVSHSSSTSYNPVEASPLSRKKRDSIGTVSELFSPTSPGSSYPLHQRHGSNHSGDGVDDTTEEGAGVDNEEKKVKAEAKSNRKVSFPIFALCAKLTRAVDCRPGNKQQISTHHQRIARGHQESTSQRDSRSASETAGDSTRPSPQRISQSPNDMGARGRGA